MKKHTVKSDVKEMLRRFRERNPEFDDRIFDKSFSLEDFANLIIVSYKGFNNIK